MSYIENRRSIEDYLNNIKDKGKRNHIGSILHQFDIFCKQSFNKTHQQIIDDVKEEVTKTNSNDKIYVLFNKYKDWLSLDHPEITYYVGRNTKCMSTIKKRHPNSIRQYISKMRNIFEEIGNIEINNRVFNKRVRVVKAEEEDPEPFTKEQMRILLDRCSNHNKLKYMVLKDSGIRVGELVQIKKRDINISKTPIEITISCYFENQCKPYCRPCAQRGILIPVYLLMFDEFRLKIWKNFHKFHV
jgi:integrase